METRVAFVCLAAAMVAGAPTMRAQLPFSLSGTVFGGGSPLPAATYDLRVTPPAGSGFGQETIQDVVLTADKQQDEVLLVSGGGATLSGTIRGYGLAVVAGVTITGSTFTWDRRNLVVSGNQLDIQIPVVQVTGDVTNPSGSAVVGATVRGAQSSFANDTSISSSSQSTANSAGRHAMLAVAGPTRR